MNSQTNKERASARTRTARNLAIFTVVVLGVGFLAQRVEVAAGTPPGEEGPGILLWLVVPTITALLLRAFAGDGWKDFGIRPRFRENARWYLVAFLVYPVLTAVVLAAGAALGVVRMPALSFALLATIVQTFVVGLAPQLLKNVFEETAWRGYLAPRVYALGFTGIGGHLIVGAIWGAWHIPYYLYFLDRDLIAHFSTLSPMMFAAAAIVVMMAWAMVYGELYLLTRSIWPAVLLHGVEDAFLNQLFTEGHVEIVPGMDWLVSPVNGLFGILAFVALGLALYRYRAYRLRIGVSEPGTR